MSRAAQLSVCIVQPSLENIFAVTASSAMSLLLRAPESYRRLVLSIGSKILTSPDVKYFNSDT